MFASRNGQASHGIVVLRWANSHGTYSSISASTRTPLRRIGPGASAKGTGRRTAAPPRRGCSTAPLAPGQQPAPRTRPWIRTGVEWSSAVATTTLLVGRRSSQRERHPGISRSIVHNPKGRGFDPHRRHSEPASRAGFLRARRTSACARRSARASSSDGSLAPIPRRRRGLGAGFSGRACRLRAPDERRRSGER